MCHKKSNFLMLMKTFRLGWSGQRVTLSAPAIQTVRGSFYDWCNVFEDPNQLAEMQNCEFELVYN